MKIRELFEEEQTQNSLIGKNINGKIVTKETENELWDGNFNCSELGLTTLKGAPRKINGDFNCFGNRKLSTLEGAPQEGVINFYCDGNDLKSLKGAPDKISGDFNCYFNKNVASLEGAPKEVGRDFFCHACNLTSLVGAPKKIGRYLNFEKNPILSLKGIHKIIEEIGDSIFLSNSVESNILGLLKIKNLKKVVVINSPQFTKNLKQYEIYEIINKYLPNPSASQIIDCQNELIDAGFEEYAEL